MKYQYIAPFQISDPPGRARAHARPRPGRQVQPDRRAEPEAVGGAEEGHAAADGAERRRRNRGGTGKKNTFMSNILNSKSN